MSSAAITSNTTATAASSSATSGATTSFSLPPPPPPRIVIPGGKHLAALNSLSRTQQQAALVTPKSSDSSMSSSESSSSSSSGGSSGRSNKSKNKQVEKVGRWTDDEHDLFLQGLHEHGKQWKTIATLIGTRTVVQVRTHAQKYFQKLERTNGHSGSCTTKALVSTAQKSTEQFVEHTMMSPKRKSMPVVTMPTRKKPKLRSKSLPFRTASAALRPPEEDYEDDDDDDFVEAIPKPEDYVTAALEENLSIVSPTGVTELDYTLTAAATKYADWPLEEPLYLEAVTGTTSFDDEQKAAVAAVAAAANVSDDDEMDLLDHDPLEWLISIGSGGSSSSSQVSAAAAVVMHHLPESSIDNAAPVFPEFAPVVQPENATLPHKISDPNFLHDPKVTVQSLLQECYSEPV